MKRFLVSLFIVLLFSATAEARNLYIFTATWCSPCKHLKKLIDTNPEHFDAFDVSIIDIDDYPEIAKKYSVNRVPTSLLLDEGREIDRITGYSSSYKNWLKNWSKKEND